MTILSTFLVSSLNFLSNDTKKNLKTWYSQEKKVSSKFEQSERQFGKTVRDKITHKTHLEWKNDSFKHIFGILTKFPIL